MIRQPLTRPVPAALAFTFVFLFALAAPLLAGKIVQDTVSQSHPLDPDASVTIRNTDGRIFIYGSDTSRLDIYAHRRALSRQRLEAITVRVSIQGKNATIETAYPPPEEGLLGDRSGTVDYAIFLPQDCALAEVTLHRGEILIEGMRGPTLRASLRNGIMSVDNCFTDARLDLGSGILNLYYAWWEENAVQIAATIAQGKSRLFLPPGANLALHGTTVSGRIHNRLTPEAPSANGRGQTLRLQLGPASQSQIRLQSTAADLWIERSW